MLRGWVLSVISAGLQGKQFLHDRVELSFNAFTHETQAGSVLECHAYACTTASGVSSRSGQDGCNEGSSLVYNALELREA